MRANRLSLKNFRNFDELDLEFGPGLTVISGPNGAGKTNILEALYLCSIGRSPRTRQDGLMISRGKSAANVNLRYLRGGVEREVGVSLSSSKGKTIVLDRLPSARVSDIVGNFGCVYFSPDEIDIVRGGPQYRRRFLDIINCQVSPTYMSDLKNLQHCLKQRNAILRGVRLDSVYDRELEPWDSQIVMYSLKIMLRRNSFIKTLQRLVDIVMRILTDNSETLKITYRSFCDRLDQIHVRSLGEEYNKKVRQNYTRDVLMHTSSVGPHLDDFDIKLVYLKNEDKKNGGRETEEYEYINLRNEGSLGQQRTATLALKIAEVFVYHKYYGEKPILLLDDVLSELDFDRRKKLMEYCKHFDTIVTCTDWSYENPMPDTWFYVDDGRVEKRAVDPKRFTYQGELNARAYDFAKRINEMADGFYEEQAWLEPVEIKLSGEDRPREVRERVSFSEEEVGEILDKVEEEEQEGEAEFDIWNDEGKAIKRPSSRRKK